MADRHPAAPPGHRRAAADRHEDERDRRRRIIAITADQHAAIASWLAPGAAAWRKALAPLTPKQRKLFVDTLLAYEAAVGGGELSEGDSGEG
ncbi:hypothetical protein ABZS76_32035 [Streptomyces sp. NPDC005562]|uniref:hypothetical protein n=1 Tax=Streptomyces sp. NPDC005562 TaxID=3154890 RepID=UPI0033B36893